VELGVSATARAATGYSGVSLYSETAMRYFTCGLAAIGLLCGVGFGSEDHWDIENPPGETHDVRIDTDEGTWMSVDVTPDGRLIAFDLLGDLYLMPAAGSADGSEVVKLTSGMAWDMQPRFSPDGRAVAFTSDRLGKSGKSGDNIWTLGIGEDGRWGTADDVLTQITDETYRLLNGAAWHPSGEYIVARKHFTSRRSLGAGEMWMYPAAGVAAGGSGGLQMTDRPTDQKDVNEPVFSPDGRYLYFSEDASPGSTFEYNKDSNKQIYVINRLDTQTGRQTRYVTGPGGSCRPTPSPDGSKLAFVRRVGPQSTLFVMDLKSGAVGPVYGELERDMQEAWAIHGVYPTMAWLPDNRHMVLWAKGKIWRVDTQTGGAEVVPFRVRDTRRVSQPLEAPQVAAPESFDVRVLQDVTVSADGRFAAYSALGHVYLTPLGAGGTVVGEARRLTEQREHFEFDPAFSRDGSMIAWVTWDDEDLGSIRVARLDGSGRVVRSWTVNRSPGHFINPVFSPDGTRIAYERVSGGWITSPLWGRETGVFVTSAMGGEERQEQLVTRSGSKPQFGRSGDRIYVTRRSPGKDADNTSLVSIELARDETVTQVEDSDLRTHYTSTWASGFVVAPDESRVAFVERFHVFVAPMLDAGRPIAVGPNASNLPVRRVSKAAGENVAFGRDGSTLYWSLGPELFTADVDAAMARAAADEVVEPRGENISFTVGHDVPGGTVALVGGTVLTMAGDPFGDDLGVIEDGVVVIEGNRIVAVGAAGDVSVPADAFVMDVSGRVVMPGFIEAHAHGAQATNGLTPEQNWVDLIRLSFGVTTIHDPSNDTNAIHSAREMTMAGHIAGPRTFSTGTILYGATGGFKAEVDSLDDARFHLERMKAVGAFSVKSYNQPRRDQRQQVVAAARELGMLVVPEGGSTFMHNLTMIVDGHTGLEHTFPVEMVYKDVLDLWRPVKKAWPDTHGVGYTPTLSVAYGGIGAEHFFYERDDLYNHEKLGEYFPPQLLFSRTRRRMKVAEEDYAHIKTARICDLAVGIGINVQPGGHGQLQGLNTHWELWGMSHGGMDNHEILRAGTTLAARHLKMSSDLGTIEVGKLADIVVFEAGRDPRVNIRDTEFVAYTIANGRVFDARTLDQIGNEPRERTRMFWEQPGVGYTNLPVVGNQFGCHGCGYPGFCDWMTEE
jgi:imidazolonepropionase-like amidohydrolase/Tol biopolymer transport system component